MGAPHDFIEPLFEGLARVNDGGNRVNGTVRGGSWSLVDGLGTPRMQPMSCNVLLDPHEGRATFLDADRWGVMDTQGRVVLPPTYKFMGIYSNGLVVAATPTGDVYLDVNGSVVLPGPYQEATDFVDGFARVKVGGRWGIIDRDGRFVHAPEYDKIGRIVDGAANAIRDRSCAILGKEGVLGAGFDDVGVAKEAGVWPVKRGETWSLLLPDGTVVGAYERVGSVDGGFAFASKGGLWGFLRADGSLAVEHRYEDLRSFVGGHASVKHREQGWALLRTDGTELPGFYEDVGAFADGRCPVRKDGRWGYVDMQGALRVPPSLTSAKSFAHGLAVVQAPDDAPVRVFVPGPETHVVPPGGLTHPVYEGCGRDTRLHCIVGFSQRLQGRQFALLQSVVAGWESAFSPTCMLREVAGDHISVIVTNVDQPVRALSLLLELLTSSFSVAEVVSARWEFPDGHPVAGPVPDPRSRDIPMLSTFDTFEDFWAAAWSESGPFPTPDNGQYLKGAFVTRERKVVLEQRGMPTWYSDVRVCFGALSGNGEEYLPVDDAGQRVWVALRDALERRFNRVWRAEGVQRSVPLPTVRSGANGIELVRYQGRTGYAFAIDSQALLQWHAPSTCRYREAEVLDALREVILAQGLAPVLMWRRFQDAIPGMQLGTPSVLVVNLWLPS